MKDLVDKAESVCSTAGPCDNFSLMYHCWCDTYNQTYLEDVAWVSYLYYLNSNKNYTLYTCAVIHTEIISA